MEEEGSLLLISYGLTCLCLFSMQVNGQEASFKNMMMCVCNFISTSSPSPLPTFALSSTNRRGLPITHCIRWEHTVNVLRRDFVQERSMSTTEESRGMEKSDQDDKVANAGEERVCGDGGEKTKGGCDDDNEWQEEGKCGYDVDEGNGGVSDHEKNGADEEEPPSEIVHSSLASLACEIDDFVVKMEDLRIEMQKKEKEKREEQREERRGGD